MKKLIIAGLLFTLLLFLNSCLTTLHPIFTEKDLVNGSQLTGGWVKASDGSVATYRKAVREELKEFSETLQQNAGKIYKVNIKTEDGHQSAYFAFLVKLGRHFFLDYYPADTKEKEAVDPFFRAHYIPMHSIYRVDFSKEGGFELKQLDAGFLENLIKNKQVRIQHTVQDDGSYFITAPTEQLQQYLIKYSDVPEAYGNNNFSIYSKIN